MHINTKEIIKKEYINQYVANDGTVFSDEKECKKYEESAKAVLKVKYLPLVVKSTNEEELFKCGTDEYSIDIIKVSSDYDIEIVLKVAALQGYQQNILNNWEKVLKRGKEEKDYIFIGRGYCGEDNFCILFTMQDYIKHIIEHTTDEINKA